MRHSCRFIIVGLSFLAAASSGSPKISFDTKSFNAGAAMEGQAEKLTAVFMVKNSGNAILKLEKVIPACGCTKVRYDSLIQPGKTGRIDAELDVSKFGGGPLAKAVTVFSNAPADSLVRLIVRATIRPFIDISEETVCINLTDSALKKLYLSSRKKDLKVTGIFFKMEATRSTASTWRSAVPLTIDFMWRQTDSTTADGYHVYLLTLLRPKIEQSVLGEYLIQTNHPDRPKLVLTGTILK
jgi:hypothetical protein